MRKDQKRLNIIVDIQPNEIDVGQMLQVSTIFVDQFGRPQTQAQIYMQIVDSTGRVVWDLSVIERDTAGFAKMISTRELEPNTRYTIRISPNSNLSPQGFGFFKTTKSKIPLVLLPLLFSPIVITPKTKEQRKIPIYLQYRTELDSRVCDKCRPHEGKRFRPGDPNIIRIGPPELGGETHFKCRCHYDIKLVLNPAYARFLEAREMIKSLKAMQAVSQIKKNKAKENKI